MAVNFTVDILNLSTRYVDILHFLYLKSFFYVDNFAEKNLIKVNIEFYSHTI